MRVSKLSDTSAAMAWEPSEPADSLVEYDDTRPALGAGAGTTHPPLLERRKDGIDTCLRCKSFMRVGTYHPVGVFLPARMRLRDWVPPAEGGMIVCATGHDPHGSDRAFPLRRARFKQVCEVCHDPKELN